MNKKNHFAKALKKARQMANNPTEMWAFIRQIQCFFDKNESSLASFKIKTNLLFQLLKDTVAGKFTISTHNKILLIAAFLYLLMPLDLIPDFIPIGGFTDDLAVIAYVLKQLNQTLEAYQEWQKQNNALNLFDIV